MRSSGERRYAMRLWLDPNRLAARGLTVGDAIAAIQQQNLQVGAGRIGQAPVPEGQNYQITLQIAGRLKDVSEFEDVVLSSDSDGTLVKVKDVGRVELGAEDYNSFARYNGFPAMGNLILQVPGSNGLEVATAVKERMEEIASDFPPEVEYAFPYDPTLLVVEARKETVTTLIQAVVLVVIVLFFFLQNWQSTIVPAVVIPVSLIGTFAFIKLFGFSINSLTLFGLTLATGMVVDDAIVVVEDIAAKVQQQGMKPHLAAIEAMRELTGAVIATSLVLLAVFVPVAFFPGTTGQLYKQFALTIAFSVIISTFNALTLTPALSALLIKKGQQPTGLLGKVFGWVNRGIDTTRRKYKQSLDWLTKARLLVLGGFATLLVAAGWLYTNVPTAFLPDEDLGLIINLVQTPEGASLEFTSQVLEEVEQTLMEVPEVEGVFTLGGFGFNGNAANSGVVYAPLRPWGERQSVEESQQSVISRITEPLSQIQDATIRSFGRPAIQGLGNVGGFVFQLQDRGNNDIQVFVEAMNELIASAKGAPELNEVFSTYTANSPQMRIEIDRDRAQALQISIDDILDSLQGYIGSRYVNDFNAFGRTYRVYVQADGEFRNNPQAIESLYVRSGTDDMIPLGNIVSFESTTGPQTINHYNLFRSIEINGAAAEGYSSGQAIAAMERIAAEVLPNNMDFEWSDISLEEQKSGGQAPFIFGLGLIFVFLVLAAQYENFIDPVIIMLAVPLAILGALLAVWLRGFSNDVYCQVGLVMLIGLASKNAILIVEFANQLREQGLSITKAAIQASEQRLRPIIMTAISTLLGIFPLTIATGAGAASRQSLGTAVFGGMVLSTVLSLFIVPVLYIVIASLFCRFKDNCRDMSPIKGKPENGRQNMNGSYPKQEVASSEK